ncbi:hypothetical protein CVT26_008822 [Gymnopilus dilepis]|uniref:Uncharacterized protein n=1 Tax=Gymnopilus dilepis TaxID=231916 RepID=A0A409YGI7_9AGAR|nr:hypothetical protein CVT26_008822 [Gymnopilus dilepis]
MSTPYQYTPRMPAPPHSTPLSASVSGFKPKTKTSRAPIQNPYDKFTQQEFDVWIGDLRFALRRALGQEDEDLVPSTGAQRREGSEFETRAEGGDGKGDADADASLRYTFYGPDPDESFADGPAEDSFAEVQARRRAKGKTRDPKDGPGFGRGDQAEPIEIVSSDEEDALEVEQSMLSVLPGEEEEEEEEEGAYDDDAEEEEEEEYAWEGGQSSSQILPPPSRQARVQVEREEDEYDEAEQDAYEGVQQVYEEEEYDEDEEENYDEEDDRDGPKPHLQVASDEIIEIADSDDEEAPAPAPVQPQPQASTTRHGPPGDEFYEDEDEEEYDDDEEEQDEEEEDEQLRVGTSHLSSRRQQHDFMRRPREYQEVPAEEEGQDEEDAEHEREHARGEREHEFVEDDDEIEEIQPVEADTSFPPRRSLSPTSPTHHHHQPVQIPDPWSGPRQYAEDFYSGGDNIRASPGGEILMDAHHLGSMDDEPVRDIVDSAARRQGLRAFPSHFPTEVHGEEDDQDPNDVQPLSQDTSFPPPQLGEFEDVEREVDLPDPWEGAKTFAEDFYSGGDVRLPPGGGGQGRVSAHWLGPGDVDYVEDLDREPGVDVRAEGEYEEESVQPLSEDTSFPPREEDPSFPSHPQPSSHLRSRSIELPDRWAGPQTYAEDFYSGGDVDVSLRNIPDYQIDPSLLTGSASYGAGADAGFGAGAGLSAGAGGDLGVDDSIENFLTPGVGTPNLSDERTSEVEEQEQEERVEDRREQAGPFVRPPQSAEAAALHFFASAAVAAQAAAAAAAASASASVTPASASPATFTPADESPVDASPAPASRRSAPIPADAEIINIDDSDEDDEQEEGERADEKAAPLQAHGAEEEDEGDDQEEDEQMLDEEGQQQGNFEVSSDIGDFEDLDFMYPEFDDPHLGLGLERGDGNVSMDVREAEEQEREEQERPEEVEEIAEASPAPEQPLQVAVEDRSAEDIEVPAVDEELAPVEPEIHVVDDDEEVTKEGEKVLSDEQEQVPEDVSPAAAAAPVSPLISEPRSHFSEAPEDLRASTGPEVVVLARTPSIEVLEHEREHEDFDLHEEDDEEVEIDELQSSDDGPVSHLPPRLRPYTHKHKHAHAHAHAHASRHVHYVLPAEVVEPETASEGTAGEREGSVVSLRSGVEVDVAGYGVGGEVKPAAGGEGVAETQVEVEAEVEQEGLLAAEATPEPTAEPEATSEVEIPPTEDADAAPVEEQRESQEEEILVDDYDFDDMYMDEPVPEPAATEAEVEPQAEAFEAPSPLAEEEEIDVEQPQQEEEDVVEVEEPTSEIVVDLADVEEQENASDVDFSVLETMHPEVVEAETAPDMEFDDGLPTPQPEPEEEPEEHEDISVEAVDYTSYPTASTSTTTQSQGQLPTPPSEAGARYVPLPPVEEEEQKKHHHVTIEEVPDEEAYIPQPEVADTIEGEMAVDTSTEEVEYIVEEVEEGATDDDADGEEYEEERVKERDISLMSVASAFESAEKWDEERDGRPEYEEPVTEGRLTEEPPDREMSLGVVSISTEAAAAFHEGRDTAEDLELEAEDEAVVTEEVQTLDAQEEEAQAEEVPPVEDEVVSEDVLTEEADISLAADHQPSPQEEDLVIEELQETSDVAEVEAEEPATELAQMEDLDGQEDLAEEGLDYIETDLTTTTDLPPVSTFEEEEEVDPADWPVNEDIQVAAVSPHRAQPEGEATDIEEPAAEEPSGPELDTDALAESTHEVVVSVPTVDPDFGWAEIPEPPMPITADPNFPDPIDHTVEGPSPTTQPADTEEAATQEGAEETAPVTVPVPPTSDAVLQPLDAGPIEPQSLLPPTVQADGLFTPAEPIDGLPSGDLMEEGQNRVLGELVQAFFWPGSPPAYMGASALGAPSGTSTPNQTQPSGSQQTLSEVPPALRMGAQPPYVPDANGVTTDDVFGDGHGTGTPSGSNVTFADMVSPGMMSVALTRGPADPHILSSDPYPYCLSTPGASVYFGNEKVGDGVETDKGEGPSTEKGSREPKSQGGSSKSSSKRKREGTSQKGKGRKASKADRRKSQVEPEVLGDETIIVKPRPKDKEKASEAAKRFPSELSQGSHASGGSLARKVLKKPASRASSVASSVPSVGSQASPTVNKPHTLSRPPQPVQPPPNTLLHAHGARKKALAQTFSQPSLKSQSRRPQAARVPAASRIAQPPSTPTHTTAPIVPVAPSPSIVPPTSVKPAPEASTSSAAPPEHPGPTATSDKATASPARQMSLPNMSTGRSTRSHCRYHRISLPKEEGGPRVCFLVPGCSLNDKELMEEEEIEDHGDATVEDSQRMIKDIESLGFSLELIGVLRQLVGLDILREQEVFYLPQPGEEVHLPRKHFARPSMSSRSAAVKDSSSYAGSPDYSGSLRSPAASNRPPDSSSTAVSGVRKQVDSEKASTVASNETETEETDSEEEPASKRVRPSPPEEEQGIMGPPTQPSDKKKIKTRRGRKPDFTYNPGEESEEQSDEEEEQSTRKRRKPAASRGVKRTRPSEATAVPEGEERESKKLRSALDTETQDQESIAT